MLWKGFQKPKRLEVDRDSFRTIGELEQFTATRANELQATAPRPMKVIDPESDLEDLFSQLVAERPALPKPSRSRRTNAGRAHYAVASS